MRLLAAMPYSWQLFIGRQMGNLTYCLQPRRRQIGRINLELCFPELDDAAREELVRQNFQSVGITLAETAVSWWGSRSRLRRLHRIEGLEHLNEALEQGKTPDGHWQHLIIHGLLHLLGYDHESDDKARAMESLEIEMLESQGIANPYVKDD